MSTSSDPSSLWRLTAAPVSLPLDRLDVWRLHLEAATTLESDETLLSPEELVRANRFRFQKDKHRFVTCRSALRRLLGQYLAVPPRQVGFEYSEYGKPGLKISDNPHRLSFNVAHSGDQALIAFGSGHQLGIDIEKVRGDLDTKSLSERFFSKRELGELRALPEAMQLPAFFACWCRKEAFIKAIGEGLSFPLNEFSVSVHPERCPVVEDIKGSAEAGLRWSLTDLAVGTEYRAAVAVDSLHLSIHTFSFPL